MTSQGTAQGRFQRAIQRRHLLAAEVAVREMDYVSLPNALALTLLIGEESPERYERAAARWHALLVFEGRESASRSRSSRLLLSQHSSGLVPKQRLRPSRSSRGPSAWTGSRRFCARVTLRQCPSGVLAARERTGKPRGTAAVSR
jgi:hypothetical protein